jgi:hypothetical protein
MDFSDIINDLIKLEGIHLHSIRPGADITIRQVDVSQKKIIVESSTGKLQSRSFSEFQRIWEALLSAPAIRVEEVLNGSGSSRNQPETIFANLPYIQWLKIDNKKHIAYVKNATHPFGTIQQMDSINAALISTAGDACTSSSVILVVTDNLGQSAKMITALTGAFGKADNEGNYLYNLTGYTIVLSDTSKLKIPCGTYVELVLSHPTEAQYTTFFSGNQWAVFSKDNVKVIVRMQNIKPSIG